MKMRTTIPAALAAATVFIPACALADGPTVILCEGTEATAADLNAAPLQSNEWKYYRIADKSLQYRDEMSISWSPNYCNMAGFLCRFTDEAYRVEGKYGPDTPDRGSNLFLTINRKTGKVDDDYIDGSLGYIRFTGGCKVAADPTPTEPNKF
jgi:hypothetical protein